MEEVEIRAKCVVLCCVASCCVVLCRVVLCRVVSCRVLLCCFALFRVVLCRVVLSCVVPCCTCVVLSRDVLYSVVYTKDPSLFVSARKTLSKHTYFNF